MKARLRKSNVFTFRLTREQRQLLEKIASKLGKSPSDLVRDAVLRELSNTQVAA